MTIPLRLLARGDPPARAVSRAARPGCGAAEAASILDELRARQRGMNPSLASVVDAPGVTDVLINGGQAWVDRGGGLVRVDVGIPDEADARRAAIRMASACGVRLDDASPSPMGRYQGECACTRCSHPCPARAPSSPCVCSALAASESVTLKHVGR